MLYIVLLLLFSFADPLHAFTRKEKTEGCPVYANTTLVPSIADVVQVGSASFIRGDLAEPWPAFTARNGRRLRGFRYCFEDEATKEALTCTKDGIIGNLWKALAMWSGALGRPGEENGHSFGWQEASNGEMDPKKYETYLCYNDLTYIHPSLGKTWNSKVTDDTLVISAVADSTQSRATVGYRGINRGQHPHSLVIGLNAKPSTIAHEVSMMFKLTDTVLMLYRSAMVRTTDQFAITR